MKNPAINRKAYIDVFWFNIVVTIRTTASGKPTRRVMRMCVWWCRMMEMRFCTRGVPFGIPRRRSSSTIRKENKQKPYNRTPVESSTIIIRTLTRWRRHQLTSISPILAVHAARLLNPNCPSFSRSTELIPTKSQGHDPVYRESSGTQKKKNKQLPSGGLEPPTFTFTFRIHHMAYY